jgi:hypothetical protein
MARKNEIRSKESGIKIEGLEEKVERLIMVLIEYVRLSEETCDGNMEIKRRAVILNFASFYGVLTGEIWGDILQCNKSNTLADYQADHIRCVLKECAEYCLSRLEFRRKIKKDPKSEILEPLTTCKKFPFELKKRLMEGLKEYGEN